ncbi:cbb3-type cytochrome oxidase maturation protein [Undibacterium sp. GrIS 1.8]|uniref:cbb3-type cytochrome oxidase assembly protein CcoS n=1 Tax=unclassified Undibacterium TaxID=2630295 RepID=UPI0033995986
MESLYLLIPVSVLIVFFSIWVFLKMSDSGQFDDMVGPALRILQDDDNPEVPAETLTEVPTDTVIKPIENPP